MSYRQVLRGMIPQRARRFVRRLPGPFGRRGGDHQLPTGEALLASKRDSVRGIFMHIHKCAGTSLIDALEKHREVISCVARPGNFPGRTGRERIPDDIWDRCVKFTFVRNPYARVVSAYRMFIKSATWRWLFPTFDEFVEFLRWSDVHGHRVEGEVDVNEFIRTPGNLIHHCSAYTNPKYHLDEMDYVGRLETLDEDLQKVSELLAIDLSHMPRKRSSGESEGYQKVYSQWSRDVVTQLYRTDIERFGYTF